MQFCSSFRVIPLFVTLISWMLGLFAYWIMPKRLFLNIVKIPKIEPLNTQKTRLSKGDRGAKYHKYQHFYGKTITIGSGVEAGEQSKRKSVEPDLFERCPGSPAWLIFFHFWTLDFCEFGTKRYQLDSTPKLLVPFIWFKKIFFFIRVIKCSRQIHLYSFSLHLIKIRWSWFTQSPRYSHRAHNDDAFLKDNF